MTLFGAALLVIVGWALLGALLLIDHLRDIGRQQQEAELLAGAASARRRRHRESLGYGPHDRTGSW